MYFDELRKEHYLPSKLTWELKSCFEAKATVLYCNLICILKKNWLEKKPWPTYIAESEQPEWEAYWKQPDVQDIAFKNSKNRRSEPSDGVGISRHHLGSRSTATRHTMAILAKKELTLLEHNYAAKCKDGKWVDPKSERIATEVEALMAGHVDLSIEDQNALFLHVNPPSTKGNVYGLGALGVSLASASTSVTNRSKRPSSRDLDTIEEELEEQKAKNARLEERTKEMQAQLDNQKQEHEAQQRALEAHQQAFEAQQRALDEQRKITDQLYAMVMNGRPPPTPPS